MRSYLIVPWKRSRFRFATKDDLSRQSVELLCGCFAGRLARRVGSRRFASHRGTFLSILGEGRKRRSPTRVGRRSVAHSAENRLPLPGAIPDTANRVLDGSGGSLRYSPTNTGPSRDDPLRPIDRPPCDDRLTERYPSMSGPMPSNPSNFRLRSPRRSRRCLKRPSFAPRKERFPVLLRSKSRP